MALEETLLTSQFLQITRLSYSSISTIIFEQYRSSYSTYRKREEMELLIVLAWIASGVFCYTTAKKKNLNAGLWAFLGVFFGIFAVIGVLVSKAK